MSIEQASKTEATQASVKNSEKNQITNETTPANIQSQESGVIAAPENAAPNNAPAQGIATVVKATGKVSAVDAEGQVRLLNVGDKIGINDTIITEDGENVEVVDNRGVAMFIDQDETVVFDDCSFDDFPVITAADNAVQMSSSYAYGTFDAVQFNSGSSSITGTEVTTNTITNPILVPEIPTIDDDTSLMPVPSTPDTPTNFFAFPGFIINGLPVASGNFGFAVSGTGDVNQDGVSDFIAGATGTSSAYLFFGGANAFTALDQANGADGYISVGSLNGSNGYALSGGTNAGFSLTRLNDVNSDGINDFIIGSPDDDSAYLVFGGSSNLAGFDALNGQDGQINLDLMTTSYGYIFNTGASGNAGSALSFAGDISGDGNNDILIGSSTDGAVALVNGGASNLAAFDALDGSDGRIDMLGPTAGLGYVFNGSAAAGVGQGASYLTDITGDGANEVIISAGSFSSSTGRVFLIYGGAANLNALDGDNDQQILLDNVTLGEGYLIDGTNNFDLFGTALSAFSGSYNGDSTADLLIGSSGFNSSDGAAYLINGSSSTLSALDAFDGSVDGIIAAANIANVADSGYIIYGSGTEQLGNAVSFVGDFNADGIDDFAVTAPGVGESGATGIAYIILGGNNLVNLDAADGTTDRQINISNFVSGTNGLLVQGINANDNIGTSVSAAGDVNSDGYADVLIGASNANANGVTDSGQTYLVYGFDVA